MLKQRGWTLFPDKSCRKIEMVVLQHDDRFVLALLSRGENFISEQLVHRDVAVFPGVPDFLINVGRAWCIPEIVLQKPEQGIADQVVVLVIDLGFRNNELNPEIRLWTGRADQPLAGAASDFRAGAVAIGHGGGDPDRLPVARDRADGGDHSATPLARGEGAVIRIGEGDRAAVRSDDQRAVGQKLLDWNRSIQGLKVLFTWHCSTNLSSIHHLA